MSKPLHHALRSLAFGLIAAAIGGAAFAAGDVGPAKPPVPPAANVVDQSPRCQPAKVTECRQTCDARKSNSSDKKGDAKKLEECKQECIRGC
ncbi:MAG: hypothetical protein LCI02_23075 [Proteobacteria bacterium]|nr:hypothetical protein [Pseudomonadota bacterium]